MEANSVLRFTVLTGVNFQLIQIFICVISTKKTPSNLLFETFENSYNVVTH